MSMSQHPNKVIGNVVGDLVTSTGLGVQLFHTVALLPWARCRDDLLQLFLMIDLFNTHANDSKAAEAKFRPFKDRVNTYRNEVNNLKTAKSEEEASRQVTTLCERMKGILKSVGLDASIHKDTKDRYKKAESNKPHFKSVRAPLPGTNLIMSQENPISFDVGISAGPDDIEPEETHQLAFSPLFEDWPLAPLLSYTVAHPTKLELNTSSCSDPINCQAWDATYMRTSYENNEDRACWIPLDYHVRMTVKECADKIQEKPDSQIRFISCAARLVVLASYDENDGNQVEKIVDLDEQESELLEALRVRELRNITPRSTPQGRGKGRAAAAEEPAQEENLNEDDQAALEEERKRFKTRVILRTLEPRSSLLLLGPDPFPAGGQ